MPPPAMDLPTLNDADFERFLALIYRVSGIRIPNTKRVLVSNRLRRRLKATGIGDFSSYYSYLTSPSGAQEMPRFLDEITTNETYFFRDPHQFAWFGDEFLPQAIEQARQHARPKRLRVWSAAASTGAELYSLAILVHEKHQAFAGWMITLLGTDLSEAVLEEARAGCYDARALRLVDAERRRACFREDAAKQRLTVNAELRVMATWHIHNLMKPMQSGGPFDCVFLKNVLIYFDAQSKQAVARNVVEALSPGGYLVLGPTEMIPHLLEPLTRLKPWLYRKPA